MVIALILCLLAAAAYGVAAAGVRTPSEFLEALAPLQAPGGAQTTVLLLESITLPGFAATAAPLPARVPANHTLTLRGGSSGLTSLDFGGVPMVLVVEEGGTLVLEGLNVSGLPSPEGDYDAATRPESFTLWPSVNLAAGASMESLDCRFLTFPAAWCTAQLVAEQAATTLQLLGAAVDLGAQGVTTNYRSLQVAPPVRSTASKNIVGSYNLTVSNSSVTCQPPVARESSNSSGGSSSSATPAWVWAIVAVGAALAVALGAMVLVMCRRRCQQPPGPVLPVTQKQGACIQKDSPACLQDLGHSLTDSSSSAGVRPPSPGHGSSKACSKGSLPTCPGLDMPHSMLRSRVGAIEGLELGRMLGRGGFAEVFEGTWEGITVAVKVAKTTVCVGQSLDLSAEPLLSVAVSHPNVLPTYRTCIVRLLTASTGSDSSSQESPPSGQLQADEELTSSGSGQVIPALTDSRCKAEVVPLTAVLSPGLYETWLVCELAELGSLDNAASKGLFMARGQPEALNLARVLPTLLDVARGLEYLHHSGIIHGDLKPQNVLLKSARIDACGFVCKVSDFGLSRMLSDQQTHVATGSLGTITHMSPELVQHGWLTKAADLYALGLLMWEVVTGKRPFSGMSSLTVVFHTTQHGGRPDIPAYCPPALADLMRRCWAADPQQRPDATAVVHELLDLQAEIVPANQPITTH